MANRICLLLAGLLLGLLAAVPPRLMAAPTADNWPQFRGPNGDGRAASRDLPLHWSEGQNIAWKTPIHDAGWSSPVIWGRQVWLTTARPKGEELFAVCLDRDSGKVIHDVKVFDVAKPEPINPANSYASPTPLIEAGRLYVHFGTYGTACLDTGTGKVLWRQSDLHCDHQMGPGSSLADAGNLLVFFMDGCDRQYVATLDKATGHVAWKTPRSVDYSGLSPSLRKSYGTAALVQAAGRLQLVCPGGHGAMGYDPRTGRELWKVRYRGWSIATRPVCGFGMAFMTLDYDRPRLWAVRLDGQGDVTDTHVVWKIDKNMPSTPSPLLVDDLLYVVNNSGVASCIEAKTGKIVWEQRLGGVFGASPLYGAGRVYFFCRNGATTVMAAGRQPRILAVNKLDGLFMASPAVAGDALFVRSNTHLYRLGPPSR